MSNVPDPLYVNQLNATRIRSSEITVDKVGGPGSGSEITASKINLGGWILESEGDGIYVTTPDGVKTKMELIDFRQVPVPPTADLLNVVTRENNQAQSLSTDIPGGPSGGGGQPGNGSFNGGGGIQGATSSTPGGPFTTSPASTILPGGDGVGYQAISPEAFGKLPLSLQSDTQFLNCLNTLAERKNVPVDSLLAVMQIESGLDNTARNPYSGAAGFNQIMPNTARNLGYSVDQIAGMSPSEQMCGPVSAYFNSVSLPENPSTADLYLANFYPAAVGKPDDYILGNNPGLTPQMVAEQNPIFKNSSGVVTVGSVKQYIASR